MTAWVATSRTTAARFHRAPATVRCSLLRSYLPRAALVVCALLAGCGFARDRAADFADCFTVEAGVGPGLHADVKATDFLHIGAGYAHLRKAGARGRDVLWLRDREVGLPVSALLAAGAARDGSAWRAAHLHASIPDLLAFQDPWRRADVEVGATAGVVSLRLGFSPGHLVDFLAGIVGLDPAGDDRGAPFDDPAEPESIWLVGDLHNHCDPSDGSHAPISPEDTVALARANGLDFVALTPHVWSGAVRDPEERMEDFVARALALARGEDSGSDVIVLPGFEAGEFAITVLGEPGGGHAVILPREPGDIARQRGRGDAEAYVAGVLAHAAPRDRLFIPTHPRTRHLSIPFFPDLATPWTGAAALPRPGAPGVAEEVTPEGARVVRVAGGPVDTGPGGGLERLLRQEVRAAPDRPTYVISLASERPAAIAVWDPIARTVAAAPAVTLSHPDTGEPLRPLWRHRFDGLEALTLLHTFGELAVGRSGEDLAFDDVFRVLDARIAAERRRYIATGGSDNHRDVLLPTMWVLARARTRDALFDALVDGRIVIGGPEACSLEARTDLEPRWRPIGAALRAERRVELRWRGTGTLVVDGARHPAGRGPFLHEIEPGSFHFYRLEAGAGRRSRSCWIYANLPAPAPTAAPHGAEGGRAPP